MLTQHLPCKLQSNLRKAASKILLIAMHAIVFVRWSRVSDFPLRVTDFNKLADCIFLSLGEPGDGAGQVGRSVHVLSVSASVPICPRRRLFFPLSEETGAPWLMNLILGTYGT